MLYSGQEELCMSTLTFDTHKFIRRLQDAGVPEAQAEAFTDAFRDVAAEAEVATKRDVERLEGAVKSNIERLGSAVRSDVERLEAKIDRLEVKTTGDNNLIKWMLGTLIAAAIAVLLKLYA
jgi:hypothetical protein